MNARITAALCAVELMLTEGCSGENGPIDMTVTAGTAGGAEGVEGPGGVDETGAGDFPGSPFTFHIEETTNYHVSHLLGCTNTDLNQIGIRLRNAMEADGFVGDYRLNSEGQMTHFVDSSEQPGLGEDDRFADAARVTVYAGHGDINSMQWGDPGATGECSIDIAEQMRLGMLAGDVAAFGMYVTSCTANVNSLTGTLGVSQAGQHVGWHNSPVVKDYTSHSRTHRNRVGPRRGRGRAGALRALQLRPPLRGIGRCQPQSAAAHDGLAAGSYCSHGLPPRWRGYHDAMRLVIRSVLFATSLTVAAACRDDATPAQCQFMEHDIVDLNEEVDGIVPAEVIDVVTRPYRGELTWNGGGDYIEVTPARGTTGFTYQASFAGDARLMKNPSNDPDDFLGCPSLLLLDLELALQTEDGALHEHWSAVGEVALSGFLPSLSIPLDVDETGILDTLAVSETSASLARFVEREYLFGMTHHVGAEPPTLVGDLTFAGRAEPTMDGEINDVSGASVRIVEWAGAAYD